MSTTTFSTFASDDFLATFGTMILVPAVSNDAKPYEGNCRDATMFLEVCPRLAGNNSIVSNAGDPTGWLGI